MKLFDYVNSISFGKEPLIVSKTYVPYQVNRALSFYPDTVRLANEMNVNSHVDSQMQFDFFLNIVRKRKRFVKWPKKEDNENLDLIMKHYQYSMEKARQVLDLLTTDQIESIKQQYKTGGSNGS